MANDDKTANAVRLLQQAISTKGDPSGARTAKLAELTGTPAPSTEASYDGRNYEAERETMQELGITDATNLSDADQLNLYIATYGYDKLPTDAQSLLEQTQAAQGSPAGTDLSGLQQGISGFGQDVGGLQQAVIDQQAGVQGNLNVLQQALRMSSGVGSQPVGPLTSTGAMPQGMSALSVGFRNRLKDIDYKYDSFSNVIQEMATAQYADAAKDLAQAELLWQNYELLRDEYRYEQDRLDQLERDTAMYEREWDMMQEKYRLENELDASKSAREAAEYKSTGNYWMDSLLGGGGGTFSNTGTLPGVLSTTESTIGNGTITGYGSQKWGPGLDFVLETPEVILPFDFEVIETDSGTGFGNRVKVKDENGNEIWFSHLNEIITQPGSYEAGTQIGVQGNTGDVYSLTGGDGTHLDITMPNGQGGYYSPEQVASYLGMGGQTNSDMFEMMSLLNSRNISEDYQNQLYLGYASGEYTFEDIKALTETPTIIKEEFQRDLNTVVSEVVKGNYSLLDAYEVLTQDLGYSDVEGINILEELRENENVATKDVWELDFQVSMDNFLNDYAREKGGVIDWINHPIQAIKNFGAGVLDKDVKSKPYINFQDVEDFMYGNADLRAQAEAAGNLSLADYGIGFANKYPQFEEETWGLLKTYFNINAGVKDDTSLFSGKYKGL